MIPKITDADFNKLVKFIYDNYGINLAQKRVLIEGRLCNEIKAKGFPDYHQYLESVYADRSGTEIIALLNKLTTNHTFFMREQEHYQYMKDTILPYIVSLNRPKKYVKIWSAGCSSGEEAYTTQMQMQEFFGANASMWDTTIYASDISENVMNKAKKAIYHVEGMKNLEPSWVKKYFTPLDNECYQVSKTITSKVTFGTFNLMKPIPKPVVPYDIVFCRNVMIYFDLPTKVALVERFYDVVAPGGYLFIGHAESVPREQTRFQYIKPAIYRKPLPEGKK